jgi:5-hydroxyisourate hydrolase
MSAAITTHVLDVSAGHPAQGVAVILSHPSGRMYEGQTDADGRISDWSEAFQLEPGEYSLTFNVGDYFGVQKIESFYRSVPVTFFVSESASRTHYHVPLLLSPFGYSTYRGS